MTDDAIQDILAQTESDPAFQALFDLFDYGRFEGLINQSTNSVIPAKLIFFFF